MGWSLKNFLKQFVFLDWITKEQAVFIEDQMNVPMCSLLVRLDHKLTCDDNKISELEAKLEIANATLMKCEDVLRSGLVISPGKDCHSSITKAIAKIKG
jgi:hypothetical protein